MMDRPHPFAHPFPLPSSTQNSQAIGQSDVLRATNDGVIPGTISPGGEQLTPRTRISARELSRIQRQLSARDRAIISSVAEHRFLTIAQLQVLHFHDHTSQVSAARIARRVLSRLRELRVLDVLDRRVGGVRSGSSGLVHFLGTAGDRIVRAAQQGQPRRRRYEPTDRFLAHTLAIADTHVSLLRASRSGAFELDLVEVEEAGWRRYQAASGTLASLKSDLVVVTANGEYEDSWFIEVDLGSESIPTLLRKCHEYESYRRSGVEQKRSGGVFPLVLWSITARTSNAATRRRSALRDAIRRDADLPSDLFRIVAPTSLVTEVERGGQS